MMNTINESPNYEAPLVEVIEVEVEKGFATSPTLEDLLPGDDNDW